jgi:hypothetical protein
MANELACDERMRVKMRRAKANSDNDKLADILRDLLITSLGAAGVKQAEIRKIVGCDMNRVNRIVKHIEKGHANAKEKH